MNSIRSVTRSLLTPAHLRPQGHQETAVERIWQLLKQRLAQSKWHWRAWRKWCISKRVKFRCNHIIMDREEVLARQVGQMSMTRAELTDHLFMDMIKLFTFREKNSRTIIWNTTCKISDLRTNIILLEFALQVVHVPEKLPQLPRSNRTSHSWVLPYW